MQQQREQLRALASGNQAHSNWDLQEAKSEAEKKLMLEQFEKLLELFPDQTSTLEWEETFTQVFETFNTRFLHRTEIFKILMEMQDHIYSQ